MDLGLKIDEFPVELGQMLSPEMMAEAAVQRAGLLRRLVSYQPVAQTVYAIEDCELRGLDDALHIYPCTHSYLTTDRQWHTKVTLFLKHERLQRILFQVVDGRPAAQNFLERFETAVAGLIGEPCHQDRNSCRWQRNGACVETFLHPDRVNADFVIELGN